MLVADPTALGDYRRASSSYFLVAGTAQCQTIPDAIITTERAFRNVMIFDIAGEQFCRAFLAVSLTADPGYMLSAPTELDARGHDVTRCI